MWTRLFKAHSLLSGDWQKEWRTRLTQLQRDFRKKKKKTYYCYTRTRVWSECCKQSKAREVRHTEGFRKASVSLCQIQRKGSTCLLPPHEGSSGNSCPFKTMWHLADGPLPYLAVKSWVQRTRKGSVPCRNIPPAQLSENSTQCPLPFLSQHRSECHINVHISPKMVTQGDVINMAMGFSLSKTCLNNWTIYVKQKQREAQTVNLKVRP